MEESKKFNKEFWQKLAKVALVIVVVLAIFSFGLALGAKIGSGHDYGNGSCGRKNFRFSERGNRQPRPMTNNWRANSQVPSGQAQFPGQDQGANIAPDGGAPANAGAGNQAPTQTAVPTR